MTFFYTEMFMFILNPYGHYRKVFLDHIQNQGYLYIRIPPVLHNIDKFLNSRRRRNWGTCFLKNLFFKKT